MVMTTLGIEGTLGGKAAAGTGAVLFGASAADSVVRYFFPGNGVHASLSDTHYYNLIQNPYPSGGLPLRTGYTGKDSGFATPSESGPGPGVLNYNSAYQPLPGAPPLGQGGIGSADAASANLAQDLANAYQNQMPQPIAANGGIAPDGSLASSDAQPIGGDQTGAGLNPGTLQTSISSFTLSQPATNPSASPDDYTIGNPGALDTYGVPGGASAPTQSYTISNPASVDSPYWNAGSGDQGANLPATPGDNGGDPAPAPTPTTTGDLTPASGGAPVYVDASQQNGFGDSTFTALAPDNWVGSDTGTAVASGQTSLYLGGQGSGLGGDSLIGGGSGYLGVGTGTGSYGGPPGGSYGVGSSGGGYAVGSSSVGGSGGGAYGPVVLDLTGGGVKITPKSQSNFFYDMAGDGRQHRTAWAGVGNGVLVLDINNNGQITQQNQVVFTDWDPSAKNDMQALAAVFDTNHDKDWSLFTRRAAARSVGRGFGGHLAQAPSIVAASRMSR